MRKLVSSALKMARDESSEWVYSCDMLPHNQELLATISNGFLGTRIFSESIYAAGIFNGDRLNSHRASIPSTLPVEISLENVPEDKLKTLYTLNAKNGCFTQAIKSMDDSIHLEQSVYAHKYYRNLIITEVRAKTTNESGFNVLFKSCSEKQSKDIGFKHEERTGCDFMAGLTNETEDLTVPKMEVAVAYTPGKNLEMFVSKSDEWQNYYFITAVSTSLETNEPKVKALNDFQNAKLLIEKDYQRFWNSHENEWKKIWNEGIISITGNLKLAQAVHSSMYYIISSLDASWPYGLSPGGLPSNGYLGHTFWDQETWMYPPLLLFYQDLAKSCLEYRFERMTSAIERAKEAGYKGLMFPWESAASGLEVCPEPDPYSKFEHHIIGDIGFAVQQYWMASHDFTWFKMKGLLLVTGIAEFWASRVEFDKTKKQYCISHVQGPDEYHYDINNSVYTNVIAKMNLKFAIYILTLFEREVPEIWANIASNMYIPFDEKLQYHPEFDGYKLGTIVKQADVILTGFPLMFEMPKEVRIKDLEVYEKYTDKNGPAMTKAMFAIGWLEVKNPSLAAISFKEGYANISEPFKVWRETPDGGEVNFITGAGGFLQSLIFGYGGIRLQLDGLHLDPVLPDGTQTLSFNGITYLGNKINFAFDPENVTVEVTKQLEGCKSLILSLQSSTFELKVGVPCIFVKGKAMIKAIN